MGHLNTYPLPLFCGLTKNLMSNSAWSLLDFPWQRTFESTEDGFPRNFYMFVATLAPQLNQLQLNPGTERRIFEGQPLLVMLTGIHLTTYTFLTVMRTVWTSGAKMC